MFAIVYVYISHGNRRKLTLSQKFYKNIFTQKIARQKPDRQYATELYGFHF
jgi:hypothetical protein